MPRALQIATIGLLFAACVPPAVTGSRLADGGVETGEDERDAGEVFAPKDAGEFEAPLDASVTDSGPRDGGANPDAGCLTVRDPFSASLLQETVAYLADDALAGRAPGTAGDDATRAFIEERMSCLGIGGAMGGAYQQMFLTSEDVMTGNVVGVVEGADPVVGSEIVVVGAHHDHLGLVGGSVHNGANDNASGVAVLLALAEAMQQRGVAPRRTVVFAAFGFEEHDGVCEGSEYYAAYPPPGLPAEDVVYMLDLDMLGTYPSTQSLNAYGAFAGTPGRAIVDGLVARYPEIDVDLTARADTDDSDFQAFCNQGVPYLYLETWDDDCYHAACDDDARLDYASMSRIGALAFDVLVGLADGDVDLAAARRTIGCQGPN